ncbi:MAG: hypothetical protein VXY93_21055, partial [Pseudomonadota bacterium]|nr:hypothetical protein [Pseudomonadota bacterium]
IKNSGSTVGTAGTINFGDNLSVSAISGGAVTITGSAGVSTSQFDVNKLDVSGISTFKGNIDVNADLDVDGHTNLDNVSIAGIVTTAGGLNVSGGILDVANSIRKSSGILNYLSGAHIFKNAAGSTEFFRFASSGQLGIAGENYGSSGQVLTSQGSGSAPTWATPSSGTDVGITTSLSGSF